MTPDRFRSCLAALQWSQRGLADMLHMDERQVRRWAAGAVIPAAVAAWLEQAERELGPWYAQIAQAEAAIDDWNKENPPPPRNTR